MSVTEYTPAQLSGVTDTSDAERRLVDPEPVDPGDQPSLEESAERSAFGEIPIKIPGKGESTDRCGTYVPKSFCDGEDTHIQVGKHDCGRRECPRCWSGQWAGPRTASVVGRLQAARWAEEDGIDRRVVHTMLSPEPGEVSNVVELFEARSKAIDLAKDHGVRGGTVIVHPYRATDETKRRFAEAKEAGLEEAERGIWRFIRENDRHWYAQVYWSPHFHIVGLARDVKEGGGEDDGDWTIQNLSTGKGVQPNPGVDRRIAPMENLHGEESYEDLIRVIRYLLSHTAVVDDRQGVTWFGSLHGTNFDPEEEISDGAYSTIRRRAEELVGYEDDKDEELLEDQECPVDDCDGHLHHITKAPAYIEQQGEHLSIEALTRLRYAYDWFIESREEEPEGGWPTARTKEEAEAIIDGAN